MGSPGRNGFGKELHWPLAERLGAGVPVESSFERFAVVVIGSVRADAT